jgi:hypothetical protein
MVEQTETPEAQGGKKRKLKTEAKAKVAQTETQEAERGKKRRTAAQETVEHMFTSQSRKKK